MVSIREKKKLRNRKRILEVAMDFFNRQGFRKTTISQIAQKAEVGTGTVYNYFPSKEHILSAFVREQATKNIEKFDSKKKPDNPLDAILLLFYIIYKSIAFDKALHKEGFFAIFLAPDNGPSCPKKHLTSVVNDIDFQVISVISSILKKGKDDKKLKKNISEDMAAMTIYSVFMYTWFKAISGYFEDLESAKNNFVLMIEEYFNEILL